MSKINQRWRLCYTESTEDGDTLMDIDMSFENVQDEIVAQRIQTFLTATGRGDMTEIKDK